MNKCHCTWLLVPCQGRCKLVTGQSVASCVHYAVCIIKYDIKLNCRKEVINLVRGESDTLFILTGD